MKVGIGLLACGFASSVSAAALSPQCETRLQAAQHAKLVADDGEPLDEFGIATAIEGATVVVGAPVDESNRGSAYVFENGGSGWVQTAHLVPTPPASVAGEFFGVSADIDGDSIVVGASQGTSMPSSEGAAYVFVRSGSSWVQEARLTACTGDGAVGEGFGHSVSIDGNTLVVAAVSDGTPQDTGAAYVFTRTGSTWSAPRKLTASDAVSGALFGHSVSVCGDTVLVGALRDDQGGHNSGKAYVFEKPISGWEEGCASFPLHETHVLVPTDPQVDAEFGVAVSLDGDTAVVGAWLHDEAGADSGVAYVFSRTETGWQQQTKLRASNASASDRLGHRLEIDGDTIAAGADGAGIGACYVYRRPLAGWGCGAIATESIALTGCDTILGDSYAYEVGLSGNLVVVGALHDDGAGSAFLFSTADVDGTTFCDASDGSLASCPCSQPGCPNTGCDIQQATGGVSLEVLAQQTAPQNRVTAQGMGFPTMSTPTAIVLRGSSLVPTAPIVFGDGLRCVATPLVRLGATVASGGVSLHMFGHGAGAGTFYYQVWFRNTPPAFCTPDGFNLSNGRVLTW